MAGLHRVPGALAGVLAGAALAACGATDAGCVGSEALVAAPAYGGVTATPAIRIEPGTTMWSDDAALTPDGDRLAVRCDGAACQWDTATGELLEREAGGSADHLAWAGESGEVMVGTSHDSGEEQGELVLTEGGDTCVVRGHDIPFATDGASGIDALAVSTDGTALATGAEDGRVGLWSVPDRERRDWLESDLAVPSALAFSPDGALLAVGGADGPVELWDVAGRERVRTLDGALVELAWSPDGRALAGVTAPGGDLVVLDADSWRTSARFTAAPTGHIAWSPDSAHLALTEPEATTVRGWSPATGEVAELVTHDEPPLSVLWSPDGAAVYSVDSVDGVRRTPVAGGLRAGRSERWDAPDPIHT